MPLSHDLSRRHFLRTGAASLGAVSLSGWLGQLARAADESRAKPSRACILLWMNGGPSQLDTFDPKPGHDNGGPIKGIDTKVPRIRHSEHFPKPAHRAHKRGIVRGVVTQEAEHGRATYPRA